MSKYKVITDLRQRHSEAWADEFEPMKEQETPRVDVQLAGQNVRAAIKAGIVEGLTFDELGDMTTQEVHELSVEITALVMPTLRVVDPS